MYRLLVADDEMIERAVLVQLLEEELGDQCRIFQAENGREALEVYEKEKIQIYFFTLEQSLELSSICTDKSLCFFI